MSDLRKLNIDGMVIDVHPALTILQACEQAGIEVPRFCYH
jgi:NADH-quinone oxidoreductase subunit G